MSIHCVTVDRLTDRELAAWSDIQLGNSAYSSPYFRPEFTQIVAAVRSDVEVAVLDVDGQPVGFLPFQRSHRVGRPVGGALSDFHGVVKQSGVSVGAVQWMRECQLSAFHFDHLVDAGEMFGPFVRRSDESPFIDLTGGFERYVDSRENGKRIVSEYGQKKRKLARELGEIRFRFHEPLQHIVRTFMKWKIMQFERTGALNIFRFSWVCNLLEKILEQRGGCFAPVVSTVYAGETLVGVNFGMRSRNVLHPWFPAYNVDLAGHSPGNLLWIETMKAAPAEGIERIDLGRGPEPYKRRLMSGALTLAEGTVDVGRVAAAARRATWKLRETVRNSRFNGLARIPANAAYRLRSWLAVRQ